MTARPVELGGMAAAPPVTAARAGVGAGVWRLLEWVAGLLIALMTALVALQVVFRYVVNYTLPWSEELARYVFLWASLLGACVALGRGAHLGGYPAQWWWKAVRNPASRRTAWAMRVAPSAKICHSESLRPISGVMRPAFFVRSGSLPLSSARTMKGRSPSTAASNRAVRTATTSPAAWQVGSLSITGTKAERRTNPR